MTLIVRQETLINHAVASPFALPLKRYAWLSDVWTATANEKLAITRLHLEHYNNVWPYDYEGGVSSVFITEQSLVSIGQFGHRNHLMVFLTTPPITTTIPRHCLCRLFNV